MMAKFFSATILACSPTNIAFYCRSISASMFYTISESYACLSATKVKTSKAIKLKFMAYEMPVVMITYGT